MRTQNYWYFYSFIKKILNNHKLYLFDHKSQTHRKFFPEIQECFYDDSIVKTFVPRVYVSCINFAFLSSSNSTEYFRRGFPPCTHTPLSSALRSSKQLTHDKSTTNTLLYLTPVGFYDRHSCLVQYLPLVEKVV